MRDYEIVGTSYNIDRNAGDVIHKRIPNYYNCFPNSIIRLISPNYVYDCDLLESQQVGYWKELKLEIKSIRPRVKIALHKQVNYRDTYDYDDNFFADDDFGVDIGV